MLFSTRSIQYFKKRTNRIKNKRIQTIINKKSDITVQKLTN
jgi:hypothetical protein